MALLTTVSLTLLSCFVLIAFEHLHFILLNTFVTGIFFEAPKSTLKSCSRTKV